MNISNPVSSIMSTDLITVNSDDKVQVVQDIFDLNNIHHVPVVEQGDLIGMVSKTDLLHFLKGMSTDAYHEIMNQTRLKNYIVEEIMTSEVECLKPTAKIQDALLLFRNNRFHAIPIIDGGAVVGIVTTFDIVNTLLEEEVESK